VSTYEWLNRGDVQVVSGRRPLEKPFRWSTRAAPDLDATAGQLAGGHCEDDVDADVDAGDDDLSTSTWTSMPTSKPSRTCSTTLDPAWVLGSFTRPGPISGSGSPREPLPTPIGQCR